MYNCSVFVVKFFVFLLFDSDFFRFRFQPFSIFSFYFRFNFHYFSVLVLVAFRYCQLSFSFDDNENDTVIKSQSIPASCNCQALHILCIYLSTISSTSSNKNSSVDEIANVNFYAVRPEDPNSLKQRIITPLRRSKSFKVTDFDTNRKLIYDFLLVINSNLPSILHRFRDIAVDRSEIAIFGYPSSL